MRQVVGHSTIRVSPTGISRDAFVRQSIPAEEVRRVHLFIDANGDEGIVVRSALFRFVHMSRRELDDPSLSAGLRSLIERVRGQAKIDDDVEEFLAAA
jgi:hypothetical protein